MTSENKNGGDSWGTLHGRPIERLAFYYDRHEEIVIYSDVACILGNLSFHNDLCGDVMNKL